MRRILTMTIVAATASLLAACFDPGTAEVHDEDAMDDTTSDTPIADSLKKPIDKAKAVEDMAMDRKAEMDKRLEEMEGDSDDVDP